MTYCAALILVWTVIRFTLRRQTEAALEVPRRSMGIDWRVPRAAKHRCSQFSTFKRTVIAVEYVPVPVPSTEAVFGDLALVGDGPKREIRASLGSQPVVQLGHQGRQRRGYPESLRAGCMSTGMVRLKG